jgi:hypothetical protein
MPETKLENYFNSFLKRTILVPKKQDLWPQINLLKGILKVRQKSAKIGLSK